MTVNERFALFYAEKRPFFLEGIELFSTPNQPVYTRQIVDADRRREAHRQGRPATLPTWWRRTRTATATRCSTSRACDADFGEQLGRRRSPTPTARQRRLQPRGGGRFAVRLREAVLRAGPVGAGPGRSRGGRHAASPPGGAIFDCTGRSWGFNYEPTGMGDQLRDPRAGSCPRSDFVQLRAIESPDLVRLARRRGRGSSDVFGTSIDSGSTRSSGRAAAMEGSESLQAHARRCGAAGSVQGIVGLDFVRFDPAMYCRRTRSSRGGQVEAYSPSPTRFSVIRAVDFARRRPSFERVNARCDVAQRRRRHLSPRRPRGTRSRVSRQRLTCDRPSRSAARPTHLQPDPRAGDDSEFARTAHPRASGRGPADAGALHPPWSASIGRSGRRRWFLSC